MVFYINQLLRRRTQKFGYGINAIFPIIAVLWCKNSGWFRCFFARRILRDPGFLPNTTPCSLIIPGKNSENSETVASNLHEAHPTRHSGGRLPGRAKRRLGRALRDFGRQFPKAGVPTEAGIQSLPRLKPGDAPQGVAICESVAIPARASSPRPSGIRSDRDRRCAAHARPCERNTTWHVPHFLA